MQEGGGVERAGWREKGKEGRDAVAVATAAAAATALPRVCLFHHATALRSFARSFRRTMEMEWIRVEKRAAIVRACVRDRDHINSRDGR